MIQFPQINLNGSKGMELARGYSEVALAVEAAYYKTFPLIHGRDYQTLPPEAFVLAQEQMSAERVKLLEVYNYLMAVAESCA